MLRCLKSALLIASAFSAMSANAVAKDIVMDIAREDTVIFDTDKAISVTQSYNWLTSDINREHGAHQLMWEPLFILNYEAGQIEPWLATDFAANDDATEWTINLRGGVQWSDGEAFDANDVLFTVNSVLENEALDGAEASRLRAQVSGVEAKSPSQVVFTLKQGNPRFVMENFAVQSFGSFLIMPEHIWGNEDVASFSFAEPIGTGPYTLSNVTDGKAIWDRNDRWWGATSGFMELPEPLRVIYLSSSSGAQRAARVAANEIDVAHKVTLEQFKAISAENPQVMVWREESPYAWYAPCPWQLEINTEAEPWNSKPLRQAMAALIDRQKIADTAFDGTTIPSRTFFVEHGGMLPFIETLEAEELVAGKNADVDTALALIEAQGWARGPDGFFQRNGQFLTATLAYQAKSADGEAISSIIAAQLAAAGIKADLVAADGQLAMSNAGADRDFELAVHNTACGSVNEPWTSMQAFANSWTGSTNTTYANLMDTLGSKRLWDPAAMTPMTDAYAILVDEVPSIPLVQTPMLLPYNNRYWVNWPQEYNNFNHPAFWWGSAHQIVHTLQKAL
ncbi:MAG: ABC transporter substrate-binding protein [Pseudomonadota bacterium]